METLELLTVVDLANKLEVTRSTAQRIVDAAAEKGLITLHRAGRARAFSSEDMQKILDDRQAMQSARIEDFGAGWPKGKPRKSRKVEVTE